ncbi:MAG: hypothetical protein DMF51_02420 [Acidobacteria bacterium]|nr:MAG: hypothetical protein DMF51_02420 [Acidobacteriota bacterium]
MRKPSSLTFHERATLGWGKVRRFYLAHFRPAYVRESLARRLGSCDRTGACCNLMFTCPLLDRRSQPVRCTIHEFKPKVCPRPRHPVSGYPVRILLHASRQVPRAGRRGGPRRRRTAPRGID